jgi:predicted nucleotidyltransferase
MHPRLHIAPAPLRDFATTVVEQLAQDPRVVGIAAAGSIACGTADEFSDLDLVIAVEPDAHPDIMAERKQIAETLGPVLTSFTGEHVGEPRLLIVIYGPPLLHVDFKFVALPDAGQRVDEPIVLWERDGRLTATYAIGVARYPQPDPQWFEDRFWGWVHYTAAKIGRGELFDTHGSLDYLRRVVVGPLALSAAGHQPSGVRHLEARVPEVAEQLKATLVGFDKRECMEALRTLITAYQQLRPTAVERRSAAEAAALAYVDGIAARVRAAR